MTTPGPSRRFCLLVNPVSGGGAAPAAAAAVTRHLEAAGATSRVVPSQSAEQSAAEVVRAVAAGEIVVAVGGDGMLASVAGTVVAEGGVLGIVPSGRGNDFARMLGLPAEPADLAAVLLEGPSTPVDVIDSDGAIVVGSMYAGVDSLASEIVDRARRLPSAVQYPYAAVRALLSYTPVEFTVTVDGVVHRQAAYNVVVANSAYYGKGMRIAPTADVYDGLLDVICLPAGSRLSMVRRLNKVYDGSHVDLPGVTVLTGREVTVEAAATASGPVLGYGDGERLGPLPRSCVVRPGALSILIPAVKK